MPRTNRNQTFLNGTLVNETLVTVDDATIFREDAPTRLTQAYTGLRQWSIDAQDTFDTWPTKSNAQKDAAQRETIRRFGVLCDRLADLLLNGGLGG